MDVKASTDSNVVDTGFHGFLTKLVSHSYHKSILANKKSAQTLVLRCLSITFSNLNFLPEAKI